MNSIKNEYLLKKQKDRARWNVININNWPQYSIVRHKRLCERFENNRLVYPMLWFLYKKRQIKYNCNIPVKVSIGPGFKIEHEQGIIINPNVKIGEGCSILNGVLVGDDKRGRRKGCPIIGNYVYIGANSNIVGNITIGNDVLIAPGAFVNFDVPDHSIVLGNPGKIIPTADAVKEFILEYKSI